jgi:XTP/dITP diphosphohydrolase
MARLLTELQGQPNRAARFCTVIAFFNPATQTEWMVKGVLEGHILTAPRGTGGFGYDPLFVPNGANRTLAELTPEEKNLLSHRGKAVRAFAEQFSKHSF